MRPALHASIEQINPYGEGPGEYRGAEEFEGGE